MIGRTTRRMLLAALGGLGASTSATRKVRAEVPAAATAETREFETVDAVTRAAIPASSEHIRTLGYYEPGDAGGGLYRRVAVDPSHGLVIAGRDGTLWQLVPEHGLVSVRQAGARGDGETDDAPAINRALRAFGGFHGEDSQGLTILIPPTIAHYRCASTLNLKRMVKLRGSGFASAQAQLIFDADTVGLVVNITDTTGPSDRTERTTRSTWSTIEHLSIASRGGSDSSAHGIMLRAPAFLRQVSVHGFPGNGIEINATAAGPPERLYGNANRFKLDDCKARRNGLSGLHLDGQDANAGTVIGFDAEWNGRWGILDESFLGNFYLGLHLSSNGKPGGGRNGPGDSSQVSHQGRRYHAVWDASAEDLVRVEPGTDNAVWRSEGEGAPSAAIPAWQGDATPGTYFAGGAGAFTDSNARSWITGYAEGDQAAVYLAPRCAWWGGLNAAGAYGDGTWFSGVSFAQGTTLFRQRLAAETVRPEFAVRPAPDVFWRAATKWGGNGLVLRWNDSAKVFEIGYGSDGRQPGLTFAGADGGEAGLPRLPRGAMLGSEETGRHIDYAAAPPESGTHRRGDIIFNAEPDPGRPAGWVCIADGAPGQWAGFGTVES